MKFVHGWGPYAWPAIRANMVLCLPTSLPPLSLPARICHYTPQFPNPAQGLALIRPLGPVSWGEGPIATTAGRWAVDC